MIFWGTIEDESDVHVAGFGLWGAIELPFVELYPIEEGSSVVPCQSHGRLWWRIFALGSLI